MKRRKLYVASSWRNEQFYADTLKALTDAGHFCYDFKTANSNFKWSEMDPAWEKWTPEQFLAAIETDQSNAAFESDYDALNWCDTVVLVTPAGNSAHLEFGYGAGRGKECIAVINPGFQADLMLMVGHCVAGIPELLDLLELLG